jgi:hypothetical protein
VDAETVTAIVGHLDTRLVEQSNQRTRGFNELNVKMDRLVETTNTAFMASAVKVAEISTKLDEHLTHDDQRFGEIKKGDDKKDGWLRVLAASILAATVGWFAKHFGGV